MGNVRSSNGSATLEPDETVVLIRRVTVFRNLQCVKPELSLQVRGRVLRIAYGLAEFGAQFRI